MHAAGTADYVAGSNAGIPAGTSGYEVVSDGGGFEITELHYYEPPPLPRWLQILYGPVHWLEMFAPFETLFHRYREWCDAVM